MNYSLLKLIAKVKINEMILKNCSKDIKNKIKFKYLVQIGGNIA